MNTDDKKKSGKIKELPKIAPLPQDLEKIRKEVTSNVLKTEAEAILGINRGQLLVRIPMKISERLNLKIGDKFNFIVEGEGNNAGLKVEIIKV